MILDIDYEVDDEEKTLGDVLSYTGIRLDKSSGHILFQKIRGTPPKVIKQAIELLRESGTRSISASDIESMVKKIIGRGNKNKPVSCGKCFDGLILYKDTVDGVKDRSGNLKEYEFSAKCGCDLGSSLSKKIPFYSELKS